MLKIVFKNIEPSQIARDVLLERIFPVVEGNLTLKGCSLTLLLEMEKSLAQDEPDLFTVSLLASSKSKRKDLVIKESSKNFYHATAALAAGLSKLVVRENNKHQKKRVPSGEKI